MRWSAERIAHEADIATVLVQRFSDPKFMNVYILSINEMIDFRSVQRKATASTACIMLRPIYSYTRSTLPLEADPTAEKLARRTTTL